MTVGNLEEQPTARPRRRPSPPPSLVERLTRPSIAALLGLAVTLWSAWLGLAAFSDNSFFTHLATGRLILDTGGVPSADPYSFTAPGQAWIVQSWLASLLYALVEQVAGGAGLRVLTAVLTGAIGLLVWRLTRPALTLVPRVAIAGLIIAIGGTMWSPRPLLFGLVALALTLLAAERGLDPRWLVPVFWLWVNTHGSFPLGLVALVLFGLGRRFDGEQPDAEWAALRWAALGTVLGVIGPLGPRALLFPVELLGKNDVLQKVIEWKSPDFNAAWTRVFLLLAVLAIVGLVRRPRWRLALPTVVFLAASLLGVRNVAVASIVLAVVAAHEYAGLGSVRGQERSPVVLAVAVVAVVGFAVAASSSLRDPHYDLATFPVDAVSFLEQHEAVARPDVRLVTNDVTGNYLELLHGAEARAFMDDRVDMYPREVVDDLVELINAKASWRDVLDEHDADLVLWDRSAPLTNLLAESDDWRLAYSDDKWIVACRRGETVGTLDC